MVNSLKKVANSAQIPQPRTQFCFACCSVVCLACVQDETMICTDFELCKKTPGCTRKCEIGKTHVGVCSRDGKALKADKMDTDTDDEEPEWLKRAGRILRSQDTPPPMQKKRSSIAVNKGQPRGRAPKSMLGASMLGASILLAALRPAASGLANTQLDGSNDHAASECFDRTPREALLHLLIVDMFSERGTVPPGSIVDAGANTGEEACLLASVSKGRVVHAIEPLRTNVDHMMRRYAEHPRLRPMLAGLSDKNGTMTVPRRFNSQANVTAGSAQINWSYKSHQRDVKVQHYQLPSSAGEVSISSGPEKVPLWTVDSLFNSLWVGERLGFAHLDLEGMEINALRGAVATLARDRPVLTLEVWTHTKAGATHSMLSHLASLNYDTYVIDELAGIPWDVRNLLCLPREANLIARSPALAAALATQKLVPTDRIFSHVFPCCSRRGACCRNPASGCCLDLATVRRVEPSAARLIKPVHLLRKA